MKRAALLVVAVLVAATGCATSEPEKPAKKSACIKLDQATIDGIAEGLTKKAEINRGYAVKLKSPEMNFRYIAALEIEDASGKSTAMLAMGEPEDGGGPWVSADNFGELYLDWGAAATDGSPAKSAAKNAWLSDEGKEAAACL